MTPRNRIWVVCPERQRLLVTACALGSALLTARLHAEPPPAPLAGSPVGSARAAIEPPAPALPAELVAAMQGADYETARRGLIALAERTKVLDEKSYYAYLEGVAERLLGQNDKAMETLRRAIEANPDGRWGTKIRFELAGIELAAGHWESAEALARGEAVRLLAGPRKDRLAGIYQAFAQRLLEPGNPLIAPDPNGAYELLTQARDLAESPVLRATLILAMGRAGLTAQNPGRAIYSFEQYLRDYPAGADRFKVRFQLGEAQRMFHQLVPARIIWTDLARDLERLGDGKLDKTLAAIRADALYEIATTFGIPHPGDDASLGQGVAAVRRFLTAFPAEARAPRAAFSIGESYQARGKTTEALDAFDQLLKEDGIKVETDQARRDWAEVAMAASFQVGMILQAQERFAEAIAAWKGYLARFPNGPQSADAQRAILDSQLLIATDHASRRRFREARSAWGDFNNQNPLDARVPGVLFKIGESFAAETKPDEAIAAWDLLISRFPSSEPAGHAQFLTAALYEHDKGEPAAAIERFKKITVAPWAARARERVAVMEAKALAVITPGTFRSGETARLKISTRNIETLSFAAYKLSAEAYFRKKFGLERVESLDIGLVAPDAAWTTAVPGYARYKPVESDFELKPLDLPGVYVVKVTDDKTLQATTLVIGSDLEAIVKSSQDQILVFAEDMKTGQGRAGARVLVADGGAVVLEGTTGPDGVLLKDWKPARTSNGRLTYLILDGPHVAGSGLTVPAQVAQGLSPRAFIYTDRPAYRPGQKAAIRGIVRAINGGQYANVPLAVYQLEIADSRGRLIVARPVTLSEFGTFHESLVLDPAAPVGDYRIRLHQPGKADFSGSFRVDSYRLEPIELKIDLNKSVYFRGEPIEADLIARYQYGAPAAGRPTEVNLPDGRVLHGTTDAAGKYHFTLATDGFSEEQALDVVARLPEDNIAATTRCMLVVRGFTIALRTSRDVYLDGESFSLDVTATDAQGAPVGDSLRAAVLKLVTNHGRVTEREVQKKPVTTDPKTGHGSLGLRVDDAQGGRYVVRVSGTDRLGNPIVADHLLTISGTKDETKLRLLAERQRYKVGEEASVNLHSRDRAGTAVVTWEADRIITYKIVTLSEGDNPLGWTVAGAQFPNFTLTCTRMWRHEFDQARLDVQVERDLRVTVAPTKAVVGPGESVELDIVTVDQLGKPVAAELSIAMVDQSLFRLYHDTAPAIGPFFYDQTRTGAFATEATNTFRYTPVTVPVSQAVVDESERSAAMAANDASRADVTKRANSLALETNAPAPGVAADGGAGRGNWAMGFNFQGPSPSSGGKAAGNLREKDPNGQPAQLGAGVELSDIRFGKNFKDVELSRLRMQARETVVETAYWNPRVVTGQDGKARVTFKAPTALSGYRITARGVTGADTLAGETTASVTVRKNFFVDLKLPAAFTQGDKPRFVAQVHHSALAGKVGLRLNVYAGGRDEVFPRTVDIKQDGVDEVLFEPFEIPETDSIRLTLTGSMGEATDEIVVQVPVRPWGVQVVASESGTASDSNTLFIGLPAGRTYDNPELMIVLSPTLKRMLIELALGDDAYPIRDVLASTSKAIIWPPCTTTADRAADLLAATSALHYLRTAAASPAPEALRLSDRIRGLVSSLVAEQNQGGGWSWVGASPGPRSTPDQPEIPSDRVTSAAVVWALESAETLGLMTDRRVLDQAVVYLKQSFAATSGNDHETRAALLHALSTRHAASFEAANSLNRVRDRLSDPALAYLALTFAALDRPMSASELIGILAARAKTEATAPGRPSRVYWNNSGHSQSIRGAAETTALVALAYTRVRPQAPELDGAIAWLLAHRAGAGWQPRKARGPAVAALASYYGRAHGSDDRYRLTVTVNETQVAEINVAGAAEGEVIAVPRKLVKLGQPNRVHFAMQGRGTFGYAVTLGGFSRDFKPEQDRRNQVASIARRVYLTAAPELDGKTLPIGFDVAVNATGFENRASQVALGRRARVAIDAWRSIPASTPEWERDFLVVEEHVPSGATVIEGSVQTSASSFNLADDVLTFYFAPNQNPGRITYDVYGYLPGQYRTLPTSIKSAYEPGHVHIGSVSELRVRAPGEPNTDPYRPTPDELYARGKADFDAGRLTDAAGSLEPLFAGYTLRDDIGKDAARMLLLINIRAEQARKVVQYFEVVKEKSPELVLSFPELLAVGKAYRDINEYERAMIVWRGVIEASYLEDARVGELLRQRGKTLDAIAYLTELWRTYPNTASIESDLFGLSQVVAQTAAAAFTSPDVRRQLATAGVTRSELLLQSIRLIQVFLSQAPRNPVADEASLALVSAFTDLEDFKAVDRLAGRFARLYPQSSYQDSFQYSEALANFHLGQYDRAIDVAQKIAQATYKDASGAIQPSPNKWQALYILGQIYDARRQPARALEYYRQVADRFSDAAGAIESYTRKDLKVAEVSVIRSDPRPVVAAEPGPAGFRVIDVAPAGRALQPEPASRAGISLEYRNIRQVDVKVYPVDLMQLYLTRRSLSGIAQIDLAGVTPLVEKTIALGDGADYDDRSKPIELPLTKEGAYLTMIRGDNLYASGIVLVTPMEMEVLEEAASGRVRIAVRDARTKDCLSKVQVKVVGSDTPTFISGETDLRGVFVAEGVQGIVTAVARKGNALYAFYRGTAYIGHRTQTGAWLGRSARGEVQNQALQEQALDTNVRMQNDANRVNQIERLQQRYAQPADKSKGAAAGGFR